LHFFWRRFRLRIAQLSHTNPQASQVNPQMSQRSVPDVAPPFDFDHQEEEAWSATQSIRHTPMLEEARTLHAQRFLWMEQPTRPYVCFQRVSDRQFVVWIAAAENLSKDDLGDVLLDSHSEEGLVVSLIRFAGYELSTNEEALLTRYRAGETGSDFWTAVDAAGLRYAPARERKTRRRHRGHPAPLSTAAPFVALTKAFTRTDDVDWTRAPSGAPVSRHSFASFRIRLSDECGGIGLTNWFPGGDGSAGDATALVARYGGQKVCLTAQACTQLAARRPGEAIEFDEILHEFGHKRPPGRVDPEAYLRSAKQQALGRILLGTRATAVGELRGVRHDELAGHEAWALYAIDHVSFDADGTPASITFASAGLSRLIARDPASLQYLGNVRDLLALPDTTPGRWAMSILFALRLHWRLNVRRAVQHLNTGGERAALEFSPIPRRKLFAIMRPDPPSPEDMLDGHDPRRALGYFDEAMRLLGGHGASLARNGRGTHVSYWRELPTKHAGDGRELWELAAPGAKPRVAEWRDAWLEQRLDIRPGGNDLADLIDLHTRAKAAQRGLQRGRTPRASAPALQSRRL
jgi:hypothetical protein